MTISYVGRTSAVNVASGDITITGEPAGCQQGDFLFVPCSYRDTQLFTPPAGWTAGFVENNGNALSGAASAIACGFMYWKIRGASAEVSNTFTRTGGDVALACMGAYRGVDQVNPIDLSLQRTQPSAGTTPATATGFTPNFNNEWMLMIGAVPVGASAATQKAATNPATGWTERLDTSTTTGLDCSLMFADAPQTTAAATGIFSYVTGSTRSVILVCGLKPAFTNVDAGTGTISVVGQPASVTRFIAPGNAAISAVGQSATLKRSLSAGAAAIGVAGQAATIKRAIAAGAAAISVAGSAATIKRLIAAGAALIGLSGQAATLLRGIGTAPAEIEVTGQEAIAEQLQPNGPALIDFAGQPASITRYLVAQAAAVTIHGQPATAAIIRVPLPTGPGNLRRPGIDQRHNLQTQTRPANRQGARRSRMAA